MLVLAVAAAPTLPEARRATDRAFRTEIAGDHEGAARAVMGLLAEAEVEGADAAPARAHMQRFLTGLEKRQAALRSGAPDAAMATLREAPAAWRRLYWSALVENRPTYGDRLEMARVEVRLGRVAGLNPDQARRRVGDELAGMGVAVVGEKATHRLRLDVDASEQSEVRHRTRARAEGSFVLTELGVEGPPRSGFLKVESERKDPERAKRLAERRLLGELAEEIGFELRLWALSPPEDEPSPP